MRSFSTHYGPWALVTGAAQGLGAAFCEVLARRGLSLLALDCEAELLGVQVERLRQLGAEVEPVVLDLAGEDLCARIDQAVGEREVGLLVNNAGLSRAAPFFEQDPIEMQRLQRVNCDAPLLLTRMFGARMRARGRGGIVQVSSLSMLHGGPLVAHYAATKAFDAVLAEGLFEELRGTGVHATTLLGPLMETPGMRRTKPRGGPSPSVSPERAVEATLAALGREARVTVGREGWLLTRLLGRLLPHSALRRIVARHILAMYPERAERLSATTRGTEGG